MRYLLPVISGIVTVLILAPKYYKADTLGGFIKYTKFTEKFLIILSFLVISAIFTWLILNKYYMEVIPMWRDIGISVVSSLFTTILTAGIAWFLGLRKLPDNIKEHVSEAMEAKVLSINQHTNTSNGTLSSQHDKLTGEHNKLTEEHNKLEKQHNQLWESLQKLLADMHRRQGSSSDSGHVVRLASIIEASVIKQDEQIKDLREKNNALRDENIRLNQICDEIKELKSKNSQLEQEIIEKNIIIKESEKNKEELNKANSLISDKLKKYENQLNEADKIKNTKERGPEK